MKCKKDKENMAPGRKDSRKKHEVEKRRRARMNEQIGQLRLIMQPTMREESVGKGKVERAEILERSVEHLLRLKSAANSEIPSPPNGNMAYCSGFAACLMEVLSQLEGPSNVEIRSNLCNFVADTLEQKLQKQNMDNDNFPLSKERVSPARIISNPFPMDPPNSLPSSNPTTVSPKDVSFVGNPSSLQVENEPAPSSSIPNPEHHFHTHQQPHENNSLNGHGNVKNCAGVSMTELSHFGFPRQPETLPNADPNDFPTEKQTENHNPAATIQVQNTMHQITSDQGFPSMHGYFNIPDYQLSFHSNAPQCHPMPQRSDSFWQMESPNNVTPGENENTNSMMSLLMGSSPDPDDVFLRYTETLRSGSKMFPIKPEPIRPVWNNAAAI